MSTAHRDSQWDIRINVPSDLDVEKLLEHYDGLWELGNIQYLHVSGVEMTAMLVDHVHVALVLRNATSKASVIRRFILNKNHGFYVEARDRSSSLANWLAYHKKTNTKKDSSILTLFERGSLPRDRRPDLTAEQRIRERTEINSVKAAQWKERQQLVTDKNWNELDLKYPGFRWSTQGQNMIREIVKQSTSASTPNLTGPLNNYLIWGGTGTGKSSSISLLYPDCYKKQKGSQYWDAYDISNRNHDVVWIDEFSRETLKTIAGKPDGGFEFLKELADRYPVTVDEKYTKGYKIRPKSIIITMNEHPESLLPKRAVEVNKAALYRKFKIMHISEWLIQNNLRCTNQGCEYID